MGSQNVFLGTESRCVVGLYKRCLAYKIICTTKAITNEFKSNNISPAEFVDEIRGANDGLSVNMLNNTHGDNSAWKKAA